jgi:hypothetical protein
MQSDDINHIGEPARLDVLRRARQPARSRIRIMIHHKQKPPTSAKVSGFEISPCLAAGDISTIAQTHLENQAFWIKKHRRVSPSIARTIATLAFGEVSQ